jgi:hypothetical protein
VLAPRKRGYNYNSSIEIDVSCWLLISISRLSPREPASHYRPATETNASLRKRLLFLADYSLDFRLIFWSWPHVLGVNSGRVRTRQDRYCKIPRRKRR